MPLQSLILRRWLFAPPGPSTIVKCLLLHALLMCPQVPRAQAQAVLFDFDSAPVSATLPITLTVGGITAHFSATGDGYSIQPANTMGFTPAGFAGNCIYPSGINLSDLHIRFDQSLADFSIMYSVHELGCDTSATMRVSAYVNGSIAATHTKIASQPGTWPVDTLRCSYGPGFDSVVVHYDHIPSTCQDYGTVFMADNMWVTPLISSSVSERNFPESFELTQNYPNPFNPTTVVSYQLPAVSDVRLVVCDLLGREVSVLVHERKAPGNYTVSFNGAGLASGVYLYRMTAGEFTATRKLVLMK